MNLKEMILLFRTSKNEKYFVEIYQYYKKNIDYLLYDFNIFEYESDLLIKLWTIILKNKKILFMNTINEIDNYIYLSLKNISRTLYRIKKSQNTMIYNSVLLETNKYYQIEFDNPFDFNQLIGKLSLKNQKILYLKFKMNLSDIEIGTILQMSRQGVNKNIRTSLKFLKNTLREDEIYV